MMKGRIVEQEEEERIRQRDRVLCRDAYLLLRKGEKCSHPSSFPFQTFILPFD